MNVRRLQVTHVPEFHSSPWPCVSSDLLSADRYTFLRENRTTGQYLLAKPHLLFHPTGKRGHSNSPLNSNE
ncbi:hypothetical protein TNIN_150161 [Trichonephila inaurata madagascariensis]|uniref:Uncharacterized protein n=1 Tax=Trichonephila inaurata madagascariensis TaxID=2747483 RepID=A0A8X6JRT6_9ARAC|nr:hypothetical protein TNIN_150161 [Trichonephila inaurata madagascariensis]